MFIEHTAGWFPFWCAPEQVRILTVNDKVGKYVDEIKEVLKGIVLDDPIPNNEIRFEIDDSDDSLGKKIRRATKMKIPMVLIVGEKDMKSKEVSVRLRDKEEKIKVVDLANYVKGMK